MNLTQLRSLVKKGESKNLEFKSSTGSISSGMKTVCAFLNSDHGGTVVFGVTDKGNIVGQEVTDKTLKDIAIELNKIEPIEKIEVNYVNVAENRQAIVFDVHSGEKAPYSYDGRSYDRNQSTTIRMSKEVYSQVYNKSNPTLWEELTSNSFKISDIDRSSVKEFIRQAVFAKRLTAKALTESVPETLKNLGFMVDDKLTNAAVVLFGKEHGMFIQCSVQMARFKGITQKEFLDTKEVRANAFHLYEKIMDFLVFCLPIAAHIEPGKSSRVERPAVPFNVLREALSNALVHRDYSFPGSSITVAVYDDRVTISNPGFLLKGVTVGQLSKKHRSIRRNPLIAQAFYLCGKIERWGKGTLDMIEECKSVGNPKPEYEEIGDGFEVTFPLKEPIRKIIEIDEPRGILNLTDRQKSILEVLQHGPLKMAQIIEHIGTTITERSIRRELKTLKEMNLITSMGRTKTTLWYLVK